MNKLVSNIRNVSLIFIILINNLFWYIEYALDYANVDSLVACTLSQVTIRRRIENQSSYLFHQIIAPVSYFMLTDDR